MNEVLRYGDYFLTPRKEVKALDWNYYVDAHPEGWWWHRTEWLDYCLAYAGGTDHSMAVRHDEKIVALVPLIEENGHFKGGRNPLAFCLSNSIDVITTIVGAYVQQTNQRQHILTGEFMTAPIPPTPDYFEIESDDIVESMSFKTRVIDLAKPAEERKRNIRKSYRQFIDRRDFMAGGDLLFEFYEKLHRAKYGNPRSPETYAIQKDWCAKDYARVYVYPSQDSRTMEVDAASLWIVYKARAYYASGVYCGKNLSHGLTWAALNDLSNLGVRYAELGWQGVARSERERNIEFFRRGFGGEDWMIKAARFYYGATERYRGSA